ncbi:hypothetical protein MRX96_036180 [Rhipicephalus microplus]
MVWCIVFGFCVFGVGWFAVDQHLPDLLPRVDVAVVTVVKHISSAATSFAIESKYAEDRRLEASPGTEATGDVENQAAGNQLKDGKFTMNIEECRPSEDLAAVQQVHNGKEGKDTGEIELRTRPPPETVGAVKLAENNEDADLDRNPQREISDVVEQKDNSRTIGETRFTIQFRSGKRFSHPVTPSFIEDDDKSASDQLRREGAAAAIIQRWFHTELKRWLRERNLSRPSIQTTPLDSQRCIDHDDGAFVSTVLEDSCVNVDALGPPESKLHSDTKVANLCSDPKVTFRNCLMEIARRGGNHVDSSQDIRCRQKLSHSSAEISRVLLRLEAGADPCASQSQVSKPA